MGKKLGDLRKFLWDIRKRKIQVNHSMITSKWFRITSRELRHEIAEKVGTSDYIIRSMISPMVEFNLIRRIDADLYIVFPYEYDKDKESGLC